MKSLSATKWQPVCPVSPQPGHVLQLEGPAAVIQDLQEQRQIHTSSCHTHLFPAGQEADWGAVISRGRNGVVISSEANPPCELP